MNTDAILTDEKGHPIPRPDRAAYPAGIEGQIAYMRAACAFNDFVSSIGSAAFDRTFRKAVRA